MKTTNVFELNDSADSGRCTWFDNLADYPTPKPIVKNTSIQDIYLTFMDFVKERNETKSDDILVMFQYHRHYPGAGINIKNVLTMIWSTADLIKKNESKLTDLKITMTPNRDNETLDLKIQKIWSKGVECETEDHGELTSNKVVRPLPITEEVNYISLDMSHLTEIRQMIGISRQWSNRTTFGYTVPNHVFELDFEKWAPLKQK